MSKYYYYESFDTVMKVARRLASNSGRKAKVKVCRNCGINSREIHYVIEVP